MVQIATKKLYAKEHIQLLLYKLQTCGLSTLEKCIKEEFFQVSLEKNELWVIIKWDGNYYSKENRWEIVKKQNYIVNC